MGHLQHRLVGQIVGDPRLTFNTRTAPGHDEDYIARPQEKKITSCVFFSVKAYTLILAEV